jgi:hypothetical protein
METRAAQEREKMRDGDGETPWVMANGYCLRSAVCAYNERGRVEISYTFINYQFYISLFLFSFFI